MFTDTVNFMFYDYCNAPMSTRCTRNAYMMLTYDDDDDDDDDDENWLMHVEDIANKSYVNSETVYIISTIFAVTILQCYRSE